MSALGSRWAIGAGALAALLVSSVALAATQQTYSQKFTIKASGKSTGMTFAASATDPTGASPVQAKRVTLTFPAGTKIDPGALPKCTTVKACPAKSKIGTGKATVLLGTAPNKLPVTAYNRAGGMVLSVASPLGTPVILQPVLKGTTLTIEVPLLKYSGVSLVLTQLSLDVKKLGTAKRPYVRTPKVCPSTGSWTFGASFVYVDGTSTKLSSVSPCLK